MHRRQIASAAFIVGLPPLLLAPFAVLSGVLYLVEIAQLYYKPIECPPEWGIGGILYCFGLVVWLGYRKKGGDRVPPETALRFWTVSSVLNAIWVSFFAFTLTTFSHPSTERLFWAVCSAFAVLQLGLSLLGIKACQSAEA